MKSRAMLSVILLLIVLMLPGCSFVNLDTGNLMRPPRSASEDIDSIQRAIESAVGTEIVYKYPRRGDYRYAIVQYDIDGDNQREAITFFREKNDQNNTTVMVLDQNDAGEWNQMVSTKGSATDVDRVIFHDFNSDGISELIVGWSGYSANMNTVSVYRFSDDQLVEVNTVKKSLDFIGTEYYENVSSTYSDMVLCNLNGIGSKELVLIELNTGLKQAKAKIFDFEENLEPRLLQLDVVDLDGSVSGYQSCVVGRVAENTNAVIVSGLNENGYFRTELLLYDSDSKKYTAPLSVKDYAAKYSRYAATDINGDSIFEIPTDTLLPGYSSDSNEYITSWNIYTPNYSPSYLKPVLNAIHNFTEGYYLKLETSWIYDLTARMGTKDNNMYFHVVDRNSGGLELVGTEVFRISVCKEVDWEKYERLGFKILKKNNDKIYAALILNNASPIDVSYDDLISNFQLLNN